MKTEKKVVISCEPEELNEILGSDFLNVNDVVYIKKSRVAKICDDFVKHLEKKGKIQILRSENKT